MIGRVSYIFHPCEAFFLEFATRVHPAAHAPHLLLRVSPVNNLICRGNGMENIGIGAGLGAIGLWLFIGTCVVGGIWDGIRKRDAQHETLRRMLDSGQPLDEALVDKVFGGNKRLDRDLRVSGLIMLGVAPGLLLLGWVLSLQAPEALLPLLGVSALVACIAIGLLVAAKYAEQSRRKNGVPTPNQRIG